jgi:tRNA(fMet)-specific endonuclease VapC
MIILDTDHFSELEHRNSKKAPKLRERLAQVGDRQVATTIISIEEQLRGRLAVINQKPVGDEQVLPYTKLIELIEFYPGWRILPFDQIAVERFHNLRGEGSDRHDGSEDRRDRTDSWCNTPFGESPGLQAGSGPLR